MTTRHTPPRTDLTRRRLLQGAALASLAAPSFAQAWPAKPIRIVHGYDSGSNPDTVGRAIGPALSERLGQAILVEPRPGAGGRIATGHVATQEPDGHTLMMLTAGDGVLAATDPKLPYDLLRDYAFISGVIQFGFLLMVRPDAPWKTVAEMIDAAKKAPGKLTFGTPGIRTTQHLAGELLKSTAGIDLLHVPFKGTSFQDLIGGRLDLLIAAPAISTPQIRGGAVRGLAVTTKSRIEALPGVPTVGETLAGYEVSSWLGLAAPARTPAAVITRLNQETRQVLGREDVRAKLAAIGSEAAPSTPEELRARVESDIRKWRELAKVARLDG